MNRVSFPLKMQMRGQKVADLQNALKLFLERGAILANNPDARQKLANDLTQEHVEQTYGTVTSRLVSIFQRERQLPPTGEVDEPTANAINAILRELGLLDEPGEDETFVVRGRIVSHELRGLLGLRVVAVDKNVGGDVPLGEGATGERGAYEIHYTTNQLRQGKEKPDVQVQVFGQNGEMLATSAVRYNAGPEENGLDVVIPADKLPRPAEYRRLLGELGTHLDTQDEPQLKKRLAALKEDDRQQDITYLANKTGWDARMVAMTSLASQFSERSGIEPEFYYALFRAGVPANEAVLSQMAPETVQQAWERAIEQQILPAELQQKIPESLERFKAHSAGRLLEELAQVGVSGFKELLQAALPDADKQKRFARLYYEQRGDLESFWEQAREEFGAEVTDRLQLDGKLAYLTVNNAPLIQRLHAQNGDVRTPLDLVRRGLYQKESWAQLLSDGVAIPEEIPGEKPEEKRANYAAFMASQLRLSYPTAVVAEMVKADAIPLRAEPPVKTAVTRFLDEHQGKFELGIHPVEHYLRRNNIALEAPVLAEVKKLQRVYQISPSDEAMGRLLEHNLDSAYAVVRYDEQNFISTFKDELGGEAVARLTYHKAHQVHHTVLNITTNYLLERSAPRLYAIDNLPAMNGTETASLALTAEEAGVIAYPTLEGIFGELDYCACEHCRSWLSPAAYLVDLLQFLDPPTHEKDNPLEVLLERRPDIQHLQLTCENTNTVLPYIDLVNEVLEHYVVNGSLTTFAGHNIEESVTTEELLANPQFVNDAAYVELRNNLFPPPLPFHQPLEALRRYFERFEVPLHEAMEWLRQNDNLERASGPADPDYGWRDILMERLQLSRSEHAVLTDSSTPLQTLYGEDPGAVTLEQLIDALSNAKEYARRLDLTYEELIDITRTHFINPHSHLIPKLEKLHVNFATIQAFIDERLPEAEFRALVPIDELDMTQYGGSAEQSEDEKFAQLKQWLENNVNEIMGLIVLSDPTGSEDICSFDTVELRYARPDFDNNQLKPVEFLKLLRFIRLWRKLGWSVEQTDKAMAALYPDDQYPVPGDDWDAARAKLDAGFKVLIPRLAHLQTVMEKLKLTPKRHLLPLLACWSPIDTHGYRSLYRQMFLNPTILALAPAFLFSVDVNVDQIVDALNIEEVHDSLRDAFANAGIPLPDNPRVQRINDKEWRTNGYFVKREEGTLNIYDPVFNEDGYGSYLAEKREYQQPGAEPPKLLAHAGALRAAFNLTQEEFDLILQELGFDENTVLNLTNVTVIFRYGFLARKLRLSVRELLALKALSGLDPFLPLDITQPPDPAQPLGAVRPPGIRFIELAQQIRSSPFKASQLLYFLRHEDWSGKASPSQESVLAFAQTLRNDLLRIDRENVVQEDPGGEIARTKMALVYGGEATDVFFGLLNNTSPFSVEYDHGQPALEADILAVTDRIAYDNFQKRLSFQGVMTAAEKTALDAAASATGAFRTAVQALFDAGQAAFAAFFERYPDLKGLYENFADSNAPPDDRMSALLADFMPDLRARLKRQQVRQTVSAEVGADLTLVTPLLENASLLHAVGQPDQAAINDFLALETQGLSAGIFFADDVAGDPDQPDILARTINYREGGATLPANPAGGDAPISGVWRGFLEAPDNGYYNVYVEADAGADIALELDGQAVTLALTDGIWHNQDPIELQAGRLYALQLTAKKVKDELVLKWERKGMGRGPIPAEQLYPVASLERFTTTYLRLLKALAIADALVLSSAELEHFAAHDDYLIDRKGWLNALPAAPSSDGATTWALLRKVVALLQYRALKEALKIRDGRLLELLQDPAVTGEDGVLLLHRVTGWQETDRTALLDHFSLATADLAHLHHFVRLQEAMAVVKKLGIGAATLLNITTNEPTADRLRNLQGALRARYDDSPGITTNPPTSEAMPARRAWPTNRDWLKLIQPINDELRSLQRDALVAFVLHKLQQNDETKHIDTPDKLFEYFLIDVEMDPCMKTSRIRQALSSVQLFIQRCLLNLEPQVASSSIKAKQWEWMNRYRVWELPRKVFLFPENWLESEVRDNKSPFFKDLESELLQSDITDDAAATALVHYLEKLDDVAKLEICGMYYEENELNNEADDVVHVIARTAGARRTYYYRRQQGGIAWTPWEKIDLNIEDNPVLPVVWKGRLFLFWVSVLQEGEMKSGAPTGNKKLTQLRTTDIKKDANIQIKITLYWSEYYHGKWQPARTSDVDRCLSLGLFQSVGFEREGIELSSGTGDDGVLFVNIEYNGWKFAYFKLYNTHSVPIHTEEESGRAYFALDTGLLPEAFGELMSAAGADSIDKVDVPSFMRSFVFKQKGWGYVRVLTTADDKLVLKYYKQIGSYMNVHNLRLETLGYSPIGHTVAPRHPVSNSNIVPFFFQDRRHVFFVRSEESKVLVGGYIDFGIWAPPQVVIAEPPVLVAPDFPRPPEEVFFPPDLIRPGVVDSSPVESYLRHDRYIHQAMGVAGTVRFGDRLIGPGGSTPFENNIR